MASENESSLKLWTTHVGVPPARFTDTPADQGKRFLLRVSGLSWLYPSHRRGYTAAADLDELDAALGELRAAGWPAPEDPDGDADAELDGRDLICDRLLDEVGWLRQCAGWLTHLHTKGFPSAVNLRPEGDHAARTPLGLAVSVPAAVAVLIPQTPHNRGSQVCPEPHGT